jgi:hypothetical protein
MTTGPRMALLIAAAALIVSACATTSLDMTWRDPAYRGRPFAKLLVVGATDDAANRRIFEDALVSALKGRGVDAVASHTLIPNESDVRRDKIVEAVKTSSADGMIATRLIDVETRTTQLPSQATGQAAGQEDTDLFRYDSLLGFQEIVREEYRVARLDSTVFEARTEKMVWWGRSSAFPTDDIPTFSREVSESLAKALKSAALL